MTFRFLSLGIALVFIGSIGAAEGEPVEPKRPAVTKIGEHLYRLGQIEIDAKSRELSLPVTVNMREGGPIEYLLVHENGKVHEAILTTTISPLELQIAMKLLKYKTGIGDVFNRMLAPEVLEREGGEKKDRGSEVTFRFDPEDGGKGTALPIMIIDGATANPMTPEPWIYTGSIIEDNTFLAEAEGSIIALYLDHLAMFNMTAEGADNDERWGANGAAIPEIGTKGTLVISPAKKDVTK